MTKVPATDSEIRSFAGNSATWTAPTVKLITDCPKCVDRENNNTRKKRNVIRPSGSEWDSNTIPYELGSSFSK